MVTVVICTLLPNLLGYGTDVRQFKKHLLILILCLSLTCLYVCVPCAWCL